MKKILFITLVAVAAVASGCTLFHSHSTIAPPEGCNSCHKQPINANWHVTFKPATLHDERESTEAHDETSGRPADAGEMQRCFECHHTPADNHLFYRGVYNH